jgi:hypothetical protein
MLSALLLTGCTGQVAAPASPPAPSLSQSADDALTPQDVAVAPPVPAAAPGTALALLGTLAVKGRAPKTGYTRAQFGPAWQDVDKNGCDTRDDILAAMLTAVTYKTATHDCVVLTGRLADPYTGTTITFTRGNATSTAIQIDHVVALSDAWQTGAQQSSAGTRLALANDPLNLLAVDGPTNEAKSDGDAATWLPPNKAYRCPYVARQVAVKVKYALWVTQAEHDAIATILASCPSEPAPTAGAGH